MPTRSSRRSDSTRGANRNRSERHWRGSGFLRFTAQRSWQPAPRLSFGNRLQTQPARPLRSSRDGRVNRPGMTKTATNLVCREQPAPESLRLAAVARSQLAEATYGRFWLIAWSTPRISISALLGELVAWWSREQPATSRRHGPLYVEQRSCSSNSGGRAV